jgi:hypothetical protein
MNIYYILILILTSILNMHASQNAALSDADMQGHFELLSRKEKKDVVDSKKHIESDARLSQKMQADAYRNELPKPTVPSNFDLSGIPSFDAMKTYFKIGQGELVKAERIKQKQPSHFIQYWKASALIAVPVSALLYWYWMY